MDYLSTAMLHEDENLCFLCWFPSGVSSNKVAKKIAEERGEILDIRQMSSSMEEAFGWMLYLYVDFERPYVVDFRTVKNKTRKCGWSGGINHNVAWEIWIWRALPGWANLTRGSAAPLKTFFRALGSGWELGNRKVPINVSEFEKWWNNIISHENLPVDNWKSLIHIPDRLTDYRRLFDVLYHPITRDWFIRVPWLTLYQQSEGALLSWIEKQKNESKSWTEMASHREISFLGKKIPIVPPLELSSWLQRVR